MRCVRFFSDTLAIAGGGDIYSHAGAIYVTTDSCDTWNLDLATAAEIVAIEVVQVSDTHVDVWCVGSMDYLDSFTGRAFKATTER